MSINIQARGFPLTRALESAVRTNFVDMLDAYQNVSLLDVRLEDINSSHHGGIDKRCQVVLKLDSEPSLFMRSTQNDMYLAIKHCASRLKHTLQRNASKQQNYQLDNADLPLT